MKEKIDTRPFLGQGYARESIQIYQKEISSRKIRPGLGIEPGTNFIPGRCLWYLTSKASLAKEVRKLPRTNVFH